MERGEVNAWDQIAVFNFLNNLESESHSNLNICESEDDRMGFFVGEPVSRTEIEGRMKLFKNRQGGWLISVVEGVVWE